MYFPARMRFLFFSWNCSCCWCIFFVFSKTFAASVFSILKASPRFWCLGFPVLLQHNLIASIFLLTVILSFPESLRVDVLTSPSWTCRSCKKHNWPLEQVDGHTIYVGCLDHVSSSWFIARLLNSRWHDSSTVSGTIFQVSGKIVQQSLARLFNSHWYDYSTVAGTIMQEPLHDCSTVTSRIVQQWLTQLFNSRWHDCSAVTSKIFSFFFAGRILQQWCSQWKNRAMYQ